MRNDEEEAPSQAGVCPAEWHAGRWGRPQIDPHRTSNWSWNSWWAGRRPPRTGRSDPLIPAGTTKRISSRQEITRAPALFTSIWGTHLLFKRRTNCSHVEQQCRYGCVALQVDQTQGVREVAFSGSDKKQPASPTNNYVISQKFLMIGVESLSTTFWIPWGCNDWSIESSVAGHGHRHRDDPLERTQDCIPKGL